MSRVTGSGAEFVNELLSFRSDFIDDVGSDAHPLEYYETWQNELEEEFGGDVSSVHSSRHYVLEVPNRTEEHGMLIEGSEDYVVKLRGSQNSDNMVVDQAVREPRVAAEAQLRGDDNMFADIIGVGPGYDWVVMEQVQPRDLTRDERTEMRGEYRDRGWIPEDSEFGMTDCGTTVCFDYGLYDRAEWMVEVEDLSDPAPTYWTSF